MKPSKLTPNEVKAELLRRGFTLSKWGRKSGFSARNVSRAVAYWTGRTDSNPTGEKTRLILIGISKEVGFAIHPIAEPAHLH